jgi:RNA polymerase sigma factor (TIGR02999 family)
MSTPGVPADVTRLLLAWGGGDRGALDQLVPLVYAELRRVAHNHMRGERAGQPLQTTALVHEAYLRLIEVSRVHWKDRTHFFAVSAQMMRRVLVDAARERDALKRGGGALSLALDEALVGTPAPSVDLVALDEALESLAALDPRKARVVELRYFGGLTIEETAAEVGVSVDTVARDWRVARLWLLRQLQTGRTGTGRPAS